MGAKRDNLKCSGVLASRDRISLTGCNGRAVESHSTLALSRSQVSVGLTMIALVCPHFAKPLRVKYGWPARRLNAQAAGQGVAVPGKAATSAAGVSSPSCEDSPTVAPMRKRFGRAG